MPLAAKQFPFPRLPAASFSLKFVGEIIIFLQVEIKEEYP